MAGIFKTLLVLAVIVAAFVCISVYVESTSGMPSSVQRSYNKLKDAEAFEASRARTGKK
jgi:hypothetical protein